MPSQQQIKESVLHVLHELIPVKDLADTPVWDPELPGDDAGPDPGGRHLDDLEPDVVWERSAIDEHAPQLVDATLTWNNGQMLMSAFTGLHGIITILRKIGLFVWI